MAVACTALLAGPAKAEEEFRPWFDANAGFTVSPRGVASDFSSCGNWLVYANSDPGGAAIRINVIDSSAENAADWQRVADFSLESEFGFGAAALATDVAFHPEHDAFAVGHLATNYEDGIAFFDASDPDPNNWTQVQFGDITLWPRPEGTSLSFTNDGAFLAVGMGVSSFEDDFNLGWEVFDTSDPDPANWDFADVIPVTSFGNELPASARDSAFSPDGTRLVFVHHAPDSDSDQYIKVINSSGDTWFAVFNQPNVSGRAWGVDFHPSGQWFVVGHEGSSRLTLFETETLAEVSSFDVDIDGGSTVRFSPDGNSLAVNYFAGVGDEGARWIDTSSSDPANWALDSSIGPSNQPSSATDIAFSSDGEYVAMAHRLEPFASIGQRVRSPSIVRDVEADYVEGSFDWSMGQGEIEVSWAPPNFDGGVGIDRYELSSVDNAFDAVVLDSSATDVTVTFDYTELDDTTVVPIELVAVGVANLAGPATEAAASLPSVPGTVSGLEPIDLAVEGSVASWQFEWQAPQDDGGAPVSLYRVQSEFADGGQAMVEVDVELIEVDFGLNGGEISVAAENAFGEGDPVSMEVPALSSPVLPAAPIFVAAVFAGDSNVEISVEVDAVENWGFVGADELESGEYVFTYPGVSGPISVIEGGGSAALEISATLVIPAAELIAGETVWVEARNEFRLASAVQSTDLPVFDDSINELSGLAASQPIWNETSEAYVTNLSWSEYRPFEGSDSALALLESGDQPGGTVTVVVTNTPPATANTAEGGIDLILNNDEAPEFGDAVSQVRIQGLGVDELSSSDVAIGIPSVDVPQAPTVSVSNPRFDGSSLLQDLVVEHPGEHSAPIVDAEVVSADDGVTVSLKAGEGQTLSGVLAVDLSSVDYQSPEIGTTYPAALVALVDAASLIGGSELAEALAVPDPIPVTVTDHEVSLDSGPPTISLAIEISDISSAGPTEAFEITVGGHSVPVESIEGSEESPTVTVTTSPSDLISATEVTIARTSITGAGSEAASIVIEGIGEDLFQDAFEAD